MKTEDLKNYIFEQLTETSDALKGKLVDGRLEQARRAYDTSNHISQENRKIFKKTGKFDPNLIIARDIISNIANKAGNSYYKARNRRNGLRGDGSPRTSTQESAFNFIMGLKRLNETSDALKGKLEDGRLEQTMRALHTADDIFQENQKIFKKTRSLDPRLMAVRSIMVDRALKANNSYEKARNRRNGLRGDGSPRTP